jgi:hypothetical protein
MRGWLTVALGCAAAGPAMAAAPPPFVGDGINDSFTVLDVSPSKGWAIFKVVSHDMYGGDGPSETIDCHYPGMGATPRSGVTITTWNLATNANTAFEVYAAAHEPAQCSATATNEKNLADAKAAAAAVGLDVTKKPAPIPLSHGVFTVNGKAVTAGLTDTEDEEGTHTTVATLSSGGRTLWTTTWSWSGMMANHLDLDWVAAFAEGSKAVFVLRQTSGSMRSGPDTGFAFTPVIDLGA